MDSMYEGLLVADFDWSGMIWLVIAFFWVIAQLFGRAARSKKRSSMEPAPEELDEEETNQGIEDELREFLESLSGQKERKKPAPEPPPPPPSPQQTFTPPPVSTNYRSILTIHTNWNITF